MPWYGFTKYGIQDIPDLTSPVLTGQIFLYSSSGREKALPATGLETGTPLGFLRCDGSDVLIADHPDLAALLGTSFGVAPANYFRLPNFTSRMPIGLDPLDTGADADPSIDLDTIGNVGGSSGHSHTGGGSHTHPSTPAHGPHGLAGHSHGLNSHTHTLTDHNHGNGGLAPKVTNPVDSFIDNARNKDGTTLRYGAPKAHTHNVNGQTGDSGEPTSTIAKDGANNSIFVTSGTDPPSLTAGSPITTGASGPSAGSTAANTGSDSVPPYYSLHFIIKD